MGQIIMDGVLYDLIKEAVEVSVGYLFSGPTSFPENPCSCGDLLQ